jgi:hypothetical protein
MAVYRTAQGKKLDMSMLARRNERTRAVGNMSVNARGDTIDSQGRVIVPVTKKVNDKYQRTVSNKNTMLDKNKEVSNFIEPTPDITSNHDTVDEFELSKEEQEIDDLYEFEVEVEEIKKTQEVVKAKKK